MFDLPKSLAAWQTSRFSDTLKQELLQIKFNLLPLQQALSHGNFATFDNINILILSSTDDNATIHVKVGIFFTSLISGCQCADDPTPMNEENEYCELMIHINKTTGNSSLTLIS